MKNKLHYSFLLCLLIIGTLILLSSLDRDLPFQIRKIDLFADVRIKQKQDTVSFSKPEIVPEAILDVKDSIIEKQDSIVQEVLEDCKPGLTCIEDYSPDKTALRNFLAALSSLPVSSKPLRIGFYGDSFIEGDVFCGSFRDTLQSVFGGRGVGYVPVTSSVTGFRNTIKHSFQNWQTFSLLTRTAPEIEIGPAGFTFIPSENNNVEYRPSKQRFLNEFGSVRLFYKTYDDSASVKVNVDTVELVQPLRPGQKLSQLKISISKARRVSFSFTPRNGLYVYGSSFENGHGVFVDNFSIRGNSGLNLANIDPQMLREFQGLQNYKLVILQFGLNLVVSERLNYQSYVDRMISVINNLKKSFPNCSFLLLSVSDRSENIDGEFKTMPAITVMRDAQRLIAQETGIAFWDMFTAMGGENSMVKWTQSRPPLGARDYTHLTFKGGKKLAGSLVKSLLYEKEKYDHRVRSESGITSKR